MSAVRAYRDGKPVWIPYDDGVPEVGYRRPTIGGSLVSGESGGRKRDREQERVRSAQRRASRVGVLCGATIRTGVCGRTLGHRSNHTSTTVMDAQRRIAA